MLGRFSNPILDCSLKKWFSVFSFVKKRISYFHSSHIQSSFKPVVCYNTGPNSLFTGNKANILYSFCWCNNSKTISVKEGWANADTWMAGTRVKYPMRMMHSSVAMFFMIDQLSLLRPIDKRVKKTQNRPHFIRQVMPPFKKPSLSLHTHSAWIYPERCGVWPRGQQG